jgi:hypothetical protein
MNIVYKSSRSGTLHAAYLGSVRVGYVEQRRHDRFWWQLIFLRPEGGAYFGREGDEQEAKAELEKAVLHWTECAQLQSKKELDNEISSPRDSDLFGDTAPARRSRKRPAAAR